MFHQLLKSACSVDIRRQTLSFDDVPLACDKQDGSIVSEQQKAKPLYLRPLSRLNLVCRFYTLHVCSGVKSTSSASGRKITHDRAPLFALGFLTAYVSVALSHNDRK